MNATPRSARLSSSREVVWILVGSAVTSIVVLVGVITLFVNVVVPGLEFGGRDQIPADLPVYPGARLESAIASGSAGCTTVTANWSASAPASEVIDFYQTQLNSGAWTLTDSSRTHYGFELVFESAFGPHREGVITVSSVQDGTTDISLDLAKSIASSTVVSSCHVLVGG